MRPGIFINPIINSSPEERIKQLINYYNSFTGYRACKTLFDELNSIEKEIYHILEYNNMKLEKPLSFYLNCYFIMNLTDNKLL